MVAATVFRLAKPRTGYSLSAHETPYPVPVQGALRIIAAMPASSKDAPTPALLWDLFCRVIDNFGDIGVCWRLACNLAERGQRVRLWVDDAAALR